MTLILLLGALCMTFMATSVQADPPATIVTPPANLVRAREALAAGKTHLQPALKALIAKADEALKQPPVSVVHNELVPPSGNPHDYTSIGPYWWPNPNTDDGLPYIRKDGEVNPERKNGDNVMMSRLVGAVRPLCLAYYFSGNEAYATHAAELLRTWFVSPETRMNPNLQYGQAIPGRCDGRGIGIIDTVCLIDLVDRVGLLKPSPNWTDDDHAALVQWFGGYLNWLRTSEHGKSERNTRNNHGSWYDAQMAAFALFAGEEELASKTLREAVDRRLVKHIEPDGRQPHELHRTKSWNYSIYNLDSLITLALLGDRLDLDLWRINKNGRGNIANALNYLLSFESPEKDWPHKQIKPAHRVQLKGLCFKAAHAIDDPRYATALASMPVEAVASDEDNLLYPRR